MRKATNQRMVWNAASRRPRMRAVRRYIMTTVKIIAFLLIVVSVGFLIRQWRSIYGHEITMAKVTELEPVYDSEWKRGHPITPCQEKTEN